MRPAEMVRWMLLHPEGEASIIVVVVDDNEDDELAALFATEDSVPSDRFGGLWGSGRREGFWLVALHLIEYGGGIERQWFTDNIDRPLLETILDVPHLVALVPQELAGDAETLDDILPRLGGALIFEVSDRSPQVARILAERSDDAD
jgi:hypothetical protein